MKKYFLIFALILGAAFRVSAYSGKMYYAHYDPRDESKTAITHYQIDWDQKLFFFDSDSEDDATMYMKNVKKTGKKTTFDLYPKLDPKTKLFSVIFDETDDRTIITFKQNGKITEMYVLGDNPRTGGSSSKAEGKNPVDKAKDGTKKALKKGLGFLKKK